LNILHKGFDLNHLQSLSKNFYETEEKEKQEGVKRFSSAAAPVTHTDDSSEGEDQLSDSDDKKPKKSPKEHLIESL
jgi:hypothetical protein